ncbi:MAG: hypothetical protein P8078_02445 [bacterium]
MKTLPDFKKLPMDEKVDSIYSDMLNQHGHNKLVDALLIGITVISVIVFVLLLYLIKLI